MLTAQSVSAGRSSLIDDTRQKLSIEKLMNKMDKADADITKLSKSETNDPLEIIDITDNTVIVDERTQEFKSIQIGHTPRKLRIAPGEPDLPPTKYIMNASMMFLESQKERERLKKEIESINVEYYAKYMKRAKLQKEYARFHAKVKNLIYLGATKIAYIGIMTYAGPLAISYFLNSLCAMTAPLGAAQAAVNLLQLEITNLEALKLQPPEGQTLESINESLELKKQDLASVGLKRDKLKMEIDTSASSIIMRFILEAFVGLTPAQMQEAEQLLLKIQTTALEIFSDPESKNLQPENFLQMAFGSLNLLGYSPNQQKDAKDVSVKLPDFQLAVLNLRQFFIRIACGPLTPLLKSPKQLLEEAGHVLQMPKDTTLMKGLDMFKGYTSYETELGLLKAGLKVQQVVNQLTQAKNLFMSYYRDYTYEINNVVGIFTGTNTEYDDPDYISKHFNKIVKKPFNSMALRNGIVRKVENYFFGANGGQSFNIFNGAAAADDGKKSGAAAADKGVPAEGVPAEGVPAEGVPAEGVQVNGAAATVEGVQTEENAPVEPNAAEPHKTASGTWAFFDVNHISSLFNRGFQVSEKIIQSLKSHTIARFTPRNCIGTATGALIDTITHQISAQVQTYLPDEKKPTQNDDNEAYEKEMKEYEEGLRSYRVHLLKQGYSGDALVNMMRETAVISDPAYVLNAQDHSALEYAWIKVQKKARELQKSGALSELFMLWGASGTATLFGLCTSHFSQPSRQASIWSIDAYGIGPKFFIDSIASYKSANAELNTAMLAQKISDAYNEIYSEMYDEYIRKPALNSDIAKWIQKNIKQKSKDIVNKVTDRFYLSKYINHVWSKTIDIVFDTLMNLPLNVPNTVISNLQYDINTSLGIYELMKPQGWRFIMNNLTKSNIQNLYTAVSIALQSEMTNSESVANAMAMLAVKNTLEQRRSMYEIHEEGFPDLESALGKGLYDKVMLFVSNAGEEQKKANEKINAKLKVSHNDGIKQIDEQQLEWERLRDESSDDAQKTYYGTLLDWLKGQRIRILAKQANMSVETYVTTVYEKKGSETNENLIELAKMDESFFLKYVESYLVKGLYEYLKPLIGERSKFSHISIPLGNGQNFNLRDKDEIDTYRRETNKLFLKSIALDYALINGESVDSRTLEHLAKENNIVLSPGDLSTILTDVNVLYASVPDKVKADDAQRASYAVTLYDSWINKLNIDTVTRYNVAIAPEAMPFLYFVMGDKVYKLVPHNAATKGAKIQTNNETIARLEGENAAKQTKINELIKSNAELNTSLSSAALNSDEFKSIQARIAENDARIAQLQSEYESEYEKNKFTIRGLTDENTHLAAGPRSLWEHATQYLILQVSDAEPENPDLPGPSLLQTLHKLGFSKDDPLNQFASISHVQNHISLYAFGNRFSNTIGAESRIYLRQEMTGYFGNYFKEETLDFVRLNQQLIATSVVDSFVGSDGFDLLDQTSVASQAHNALMGQVYINTSFALNSASYRLADEEIARLEKEFEQKLEALKDTDEDRYVKIKTQTSNLKIKASTYLDREFVPLYNEIERLKTIKNDAYEAALASLPNYVLEMLKTNKKQVIQKHLATVQRMRKSLQSLQAKVSSLNECQPMTEEEKASFDAVNDIKSNIGSIDDININTGQYLFDANNKHQSLSAVKDGLRNQNSIMSVLDKGCMPDDKIDLLNSRIAAFENVLNEIEYALFESLHSDGLNIGLFLSKINSILLENESLHHMTDAYVNYNDSYKKYKSDINILMQYYTSIYVATLQAKIDELNDSNKQTIADGLERFKEMTDELDPNLKALEGTTNAIRLQTQTFTALNYVPENTYRRPNESPADHAKRLEGIYAFAREKSQEINTSYDNIELFFAGLTGGVTGASILSKATVSRTHTFGRIALYEEEIQDLRKRGGEEEVEKEVKKWIKYLKNQLKNESNLEMREYLTKIIAYLENVLTKKRESTEKEINDINADLEFPSALLPFVPVDFVQRYIRLRNAINQYNKNVARIHFLQKALGTSITGKEGSRELTAEEKAMFDELLTLLTQTRTAFNEIKDRLESYYKEKEKALKKAGKDFLKYAKEQAKKKSSDRTKFGKTKLEQEKQRLTKLLLDLTIIQDQENIAKIKKRIDDIDAILKNRELINSIVNAFYSANMYDPAMQSQLDLLDTLIDIDSELMSAFLTTHGDDEGREKYEKSMNDKLQKIYDTEYRLALSLRDSAYKAHVEPIKRKARALLGRYNFIYKNKDESLRLPLTPEIEAKITFLENIVNGVTSLMPSLTGRPDLQSLYAITAQLYDFVKNNTGNASVIAELNSIGEKIRPSEALHNKLLSIVSKDHRDALFRLLKENNDALNSAYPFYTNADSFLTTYGKDSSVPHLKDEEAKSKFKQELQDFVEKQRKAYARIQSLISYAVLAPAGTDYINREIQTISTFFDSFRDEKLMLEHRFDKTWKPLQERQNIIHTTNNRIILFNHDIQTAESRLKGLKERYNRQLKMNSKVNMISATTNLKLIELQISQLESEIENRKRLVESWKENIQLFLKREKDKKDMDTFDSDMRQFEKEFETETRLIPSSISFAKGAWISPTTTKPNTRGSELDNIDEFITGKLDENDTYLADIKSAFRLNVKYDNELLKLMNEIRTYHDCKSPEYKPVCDMYDEVYTAENAPSPHFVGMKRGDFVAQKKIYYEELGIYEDTVPDNILDVLATKLDDPNTDDREKGFIKDILAHVGMTAEASRHLTTEEANEIAPSLLSMLSKLKTEAFKIQQRLLKEYNMKDIPTTMKKPSLRNEKLHLQYTLVTKYNELFQSITNLETLLNKLSTNYTIKNLLLSEFATVTEQTRLTEEDELILKGIVQQVRNEQLMTVANIDVYKHVVANVRSSTNVLFRWNKNTNVDAIDQMDLSWLNHGLVDSRSAVARVAATTAVGAVAGAAAYAAARSYIKPFYDEKLTEVKDIVQQPINAFVKKVQSYVDPITKKVIEPGATYIINATGAIIGYVTKAGTYVMEKGKKLGEETYTYVKPTLDSAKKVIGWTIENLNNAKNIVINAAGTIVGIVSEYTDRFVESVKKYGTDVSKYLVDATGAVIGYIDKTGKQVLELGINLATTAYSTIEPALNAVGEVIGYAFDALSPYANVVINKTGAFIGMVSDEIGAIVGVAGELVGTLQSYVWDKTGKLVGRAKEIIDDVGRRVKVVVNAAGVVALVIVGNAIYDVSKRAIQWASDKAETAKAAYEAVKAKIGEAWESLKTQASEYWNAFYEDSGIKHVHDLLKTQWNELQKAYKDVIPVSRQHAQDAFRIEFIISNFLEQNSQAIIDSQLSVKELQEFLRGVLRSKENPCVPNMTQNCEKYAQILNADAYNILIAQNNLGTPVDYITTFFLDAIYMNQNELPLNYLGSQNIDIGSRIQNFIGLEEIKNPTAFQSYVYAAVHTASEVSTEALIFLQFAGGLLEDKIILGHALPTLVKSGYAVAPTKMPLLARMFLSSPKLMIGGIAFLGGVAGGALGTGFVHLMKSLDIIEGTRTQYIAAGVVGAAGGTFIAGFAASMAAAGFANPLTWKLASWGVIETAAAAAVSIPAMVVLKIFIIGAAAAKLGFMIADWYLVKKHKREGETAEQTTKRVLTIARRSFVSIGSYMHDIPLFTDASGFVIFEKSAYKLTQLLTKHREKLKQKGGPFAKLFKNDDPLPFNWFKNTSQYGLTESDIHAMIREVLQIDSDLVYRIQHGGVKNRGANNNNFENAASHMSNMETAVLNEENNRENSNDDLITSIQYNFETLYFYIFLSNFHLLSYNIDEKDLAYLCASQFTEYLRNTLIYLLHVVLFDIEIEEFPTYVVAVPWSEQNIVIEFPAVLNQFVLPEEIKRAISS